MYYKGFCNDIEEEFVLLIASRHCLKLRLGRNSI